MLRSQAAQESAEVVSQTMQNAQVQFTAREFSKEWGWMGRGKMIETRVELDS